MPEQSGSNPDDERNDPEWRAQNEVTRRQELGVDDERLQPPKSETLHLLIGQAERVLDLHPEAIYSAATDFRLGDGLYASVGYSKANGSDEEHCSLIIERYTEEEGWGVDPEDDEESEMIAEFGHPEPDAPITERELPLSGKVYDHDAFRQVVARARKHGSPKLLRDALQALVQVDEGLASKAEDPIEALAASYGQAADNLVELGRSIPRDQASQTSQHLNIPLPDDSSIMINQVLEPEVRYTRRRLEVQHTTIDGRVRTFALATGAEPPTFTDVRDLGEEDWDAIPIRERTTTTRGDTDMPEESEVDLDIASQGNALWALEQLRAIDV